MRAMTALKIAAALTAALAVSACSKDEPTTSASDSSAAGGMGSGSSSSSMSNIRPGSLADFQQNVGDRVFFDYDQHTLTSEGEAVLSSQIEWMKKYADKNQIVIEGHCDERGTREYNLALGARRANSVKSFLVSHGVPARQIKTISYGKERPEVQSSDESAWSKNRRAVTVLVDFQGS